MTSVDSPTHPPCAYAPPVVCKGGVKRLPQPKTLEDLISGLHVIFEDDNINVDEVKEYMESYVANPEEWKSMATFDTHRSDFDIGHVVEFVVEGWIKTNIAVCFVSLQMIRRQFFFCFKSGKKKYRTGCCWHFSQRCGVCFHGFPYTMLPWVNEQMERVRGMRNGGRAMRFEFEALDSVKNDHVVVLRASLGTYWRAQPTNPRFSNNLRLL